MCTAKKTIPSSCSAIPKRRKNQYATRASVRKPPPKASSENNAVILVTTVLHAALISIFGDVAALGQSTSTADERHSKLLPLQNKKLYIQLIQVNKKVGLTKKTGTENEATNPHTKA